nr:SlyX family protein [Pelagibacterium limicola]
MPEAGDLSSRIEALEIRAIHQERTIEELNTLVTEQWREIDRLKRRLTMIDDELAAVENLARSGTKEPPPPHY